MHLLWEKDSHVEELPQNVGWAGKPQRDALHLLRKQET